MQYKLLNYQSLYIFNLNQTIQNECPITKLVKIIYQNIMQKILNVNETKVYSRKQVLGWVQSTGYIFEQLKNGLFFIYILRKLVPHDILKYKIYEKPVNQYQHTLNMNIVKKVLNKHNLQLNMNVQQIVLTKNCFELANWFKNLYDQNKSDKDTQFHDSEKSKSPDKNDNQIDGQIQILIHTSNYRSLERANTPNTPRYPLENSKKLGRVPSGFIGIPKPQLNFPQTCKIPRPPSFIFQKKSSQQKHDRPKSIKSAKSKTKSIQKNGMKTSNSFFGQPKKKTKQKIPTQQQNLIMMMKIQSLEEKIMSFQNILKEISSHIRQKNCTNQIQKLKTEVLNIIYKSPTYVQ